MTDADREEIVRLMREERADRQEWRRQFLADFEATLARTLHPSVLRPAPATLPVPANDPEPDPPLHAA